MHTDVLEQSELTCIISGETIDPESKIALSRQGRGTWLLNRFPAVSAALVAPLDADESHHTPAAGEQVPGLSF